MDDKKRIKLIMSIISQRKKNDIDFDIEVFCARIDLYHDLNSNKQFRVKLI